MAVKCRYFTPLNLEKMGRKIFAKYFLFCHSHAMCSVRSLPEPSCCSAILRLPKPFVWGFLTETAVNITVLRLLVSFMPMIRLGDLWDDRGCVESQPEKNPRDPHATCYNQCRCHLLWLILFAQDNLQMFLMTNQDFLSILAQLHHNFTLTTSM